MPKGQCPVVSDSAMTQAGIPWLLILLLGLAGGYILGREGKRYGSK